MLLCAAVCCSVLQCVTVCCSALQYVAVCCSVVQCVAVCCSVLQCVALCCSVLLCVAACCSVLQRVAVPFPLDTGVGEKCLSIFKSRCCVFTCMCVCPPFGSLHGSGSILAAF